MPNYTSRVSALLQLLLPHRCPVCESDCGDYFCERCVAAFKLNSTACARCAVPLEISNSVVCGQCLKHPTHFDRCIAPYVYDSKLSSAIFEFKQQNKLRCGRQLTKLLAFEVARQGANNVDALIPIPLHWRTQLKRGFNQSELIAHWLSSWFDLPTIKLLAKKMPTRNQKSLSRSERVENMKRTFQLKKEIGNLNKVAIIDDVVTSGATANRCAEILKHAGISRVDIWSIARTPSPSADFIYSQNRRKITPDIES